MSRVTAASPASGRAAGPWTAPCPGGHRWRGEAGGCSDQKLGVTNARHFSGAGGFEVPQILTSFGQKAASSNQARPSRVGDQRGMSENVACHSHAARCPLPAPHRGCTGVLMARSCCRDSGSLFSSALLPVSLKPCVTSGNVGILRKKKSKFISFQEKIQATLKK